LATSGNAPGVGPGGTPRSKWLHRPRLVYVGVAVMSVVVVVLLVLIGVGRLALPGTTPATVTINEIRWYILQGTENGHGWFGENLTVLGAEDGLPWRLASGATFTVAITLLATSEKPIYSANATLPFRLTSTSPPLPSTPTGVDDFLFRATIAAPSISSDTAYNLSVTINALNPPSS